MTRAEWTHKSMEEEWLLAQVVFTPVALQV